TRTDEAASTPRTTPTPPSSTDTPATNAANAPEADRQALNTALASWVAASNARDLDRHMTFYMPRLDTYYLSNGVAAAAVRRDKAAVITQARSVRIDTDPPAITFARDGRTAVMEFRKQYAIDGGSINSTGEVVQELIWRKTDDGWRIISERDKRVIR
ncbi:MAG TPA: nuclear transport factor 2 family protein, partial [Pyrinomonadaceae bacterium]|nr:nuclear transport factor 2 family protein [Pyrinomonadaceae bacterium]